MFRMMPNMTVGNRNIKKIASKIDHIKVLECERQALISKISREASAIYGKKPWEEMMRYKDGSENTIIYMCPLGKGLYEYCSTAPTKGPCKSSISWESSPCRTSSKSPIERGMKREE
jgi:hypothetical protein